jgi:hypothetical protein
MIRIKDIGAFPILCHLITHGRGFRALGEIPFAFSLAESRLCGRNTPSQTKKRATGLEGFANTIKAIPAAKRAAPQSAPRHALLFDDHEAIGAPRGSYVRQTKLLFTTTRFAARRTKRKPFDTLMLLFPTCVRAIARAQIIDVAKGKRK